ncbi:MAG: TIGR02452 family protein [Clostridia bacterium]|nr:TIGR02452 family protein [Clostridia bacterium]
MRIAVLFGSFNPMTNAHIAAMKTAVESLDADKGLFVATNGQYLKRKTVKISDPFYLSEEERKEIIEKVCENEDKLGFWGYELGGINPSRYKTLMKIQKQYPDAEIYEIMGADKVRTLSMSKHGEEYVGNIRFAVFERNGIEVEQLFAENRLLDAHRDSFVILPELEEISSTEVRRRFYEGEDYSDLVPVPAAEVLGRHKTSDFSISFAEKMQVMMKTGRFGENNARKVVYGENLKLFLAWKDGKNEIDFGDYREFLDSTKLYKTAYDVSDLGTVYETTETSCINADCVDLAEQLLAQGYNPAILNLASAKKPGGGYRDGMGAQEESLCRSSNLSLSLYQYGDPKYINVRECGVPVKEIGYPLDLNYGGIYTPRATFFRNNRDKFYTLRDTTFKCDVITVAALSFNGRSNFAYADEMSYRAPDGTFTPEGEEIMLNKIRTIFRMGVEHGKDALVLGAFGCGAYRLPSSEVARQFRMVMEEPEFKNKFKLLVFAILEKPRKPHGLDGMFAPFYEEFGAYAP